MPFSSLLVQCDVKPEEAPDHVGVTPPDGASLAGAMKAPALAALAIAGALGSAVMLRVMAPTPPISNEPQLAQVPQSSPPQPPASMPGPPGPTTVATATALDLALAAPTSAPSSLSLGPATDTAAEAEQVHHIDELVAAGRLGEAHAEAMDFVQAHPSGAIAAHVMNLMGVHPRPAGAVPPTPAPDSPGR